MTKLHALYSAQDLGMVDAMLEVLVVGWGVLRTLGASEGCLTSWGVGNVEVCSDTSVPGMGEADRIYTREYDLED